MMRTSRYAFIQAKIYGILAKSYIGENYKEILRVRKIGELFDLLYPGERKDLPEYMLTADLEHRIVVESIRSMTMVLDLLGNDEPILVHILRKYEYQALKSVIRELVSGAAGGVAVWDLGRYAGIDLGGSKEYRSAIESSSYSWIVPMLAGTPIVRIENALDRDYYIRFQKTAAALPPRDRAGVMRLVSLETVLANAIWALRLRFYFGLDAEKAEELLVPGLGDTYRKAIMQSFEIPADSLDGWRRWKLGWLVEDQLGENFKSPDPIRAERSATRRLYKRAHQLFHQDPFTLTPLVAFFKLKEYESSLLSTAAEALRLSVTEQEVLSLIGAE
jgi:vacuolar-type H+-ATPase subunit C/Vma6